MHELMKTSMFRRNCWSGIGDFYLIRYNISLEFSGLSTIYCLPNIGIYMNKYDIFIKHNFITKLIDFLLVDMNTTIHQRPH